MRKPVRLGIGGPVGSGKTASSRPALPRELGDRYSLAAITNDIFTKEDAEFVTRSGRRSTRAASSGSRPAAARTRRSARTCR